MSYISQTPFTTKQCIQANLLQGHHPSEWNPNLASFLKGKRGVNQSEGSQGKERTQDSSYHLFNPSKTVSSLRRALQVSILTAANGGSILFIGISPIQGTHQQVTRKQSVKSSSRKAHNKKAKGLRSINQVTSPYGRILETSALACNQPYFNADYQT
jgi:ribosomal protein S2